MLKKQIFLGLKNPFDENYHGTYQSR